jgi:hypothetical protein
MLAVKFALNLKLLSCNEVGLSHRWCCLHLTIQPSFYPETVPKVGEDKFALSNAESQLKQVCCIAVLSTLTTIVLSIPETVPVKCYTMVLLNLKRFELQLKLVCSHRWLTFPIQPSFYQFPKCSCKCEDATAFKFNVLKCYRNWFVASLVLSTFDKPTIVLSIPETSECC